MAGPFTPQERVLIEVANETSEFLGHHHHGHHGHHGHGHHKQFKAPEKLTTDMGLFALKKLSAIDPYKLTVHQTRLLQPVTPGPVTYFINVGFYALSGLYGLHLWRTRGFRGFATLAVIPYVALVAGRHITNQGLSYARQFLYANQRSNLVKDFVGRYGEDYLLNVLNPSFRLS